MIDPKVLGSGQLQLRASRPISKSRAYKMGLKLAPNGPKRKCLLLGCEVETNHPGGYCCADHCRKGRA